MPRPSIVVLTGAGISKESGLDTFRDAGGLWSRVRLEDVATPEAFARDPSRVHRFYNARRRNLLTNNVEPNAAHTALAILEREWDGAFLLVTQNLDDLHDRAGSRRLIHMHGEMLKSRCESCGAVLPCRDDLGVDTACPRCAEAGGMRPHVVWFGEMPFEMDRIYAALGACRIFISIGTSGSVYPAANVVAAARAVGAQTVELNLEPSEGASLFAECHYGPATRVVPTYVERFLAQVG